MSKTTEIRNAVKEIAMQVGLNNILNMHVTAIAEKHNCSCSTVQNAMNYFLYSPQQKAFREKYITY
ncbi:MAG: hypothetical protein ABS949_14690 [Solibacillus sp.]